MAEEVANEVAVSESEPSGFKPITSQEDFDKAISARIQREKSKFSDYDDLKSKVSGFDSQIEAAKAEGRSLAEADLASKLFDAEVRAAAIVAGFHDPSDALSQFGEREAFIDGLTVDQKKLGERLTELATQKPYLVKDAQIKPKMTLKPRLKDSQEKRVSSDGKSPRAAAALREFSSKR